VRATVIYAGPPRGRKRGSVLIRPAKWLHVTWIRNFPQHCVYLGHLTTSVISCNVTNLPSFWKHMFISVTAKVLNCSPSLIMPFRYRERKWYCFDTNHFTTTKPYFEESYFLGCGVVTSVWRTCVYFFRLYGVKSQKLVFFRVTYFFYFSLFYSCNNILRRRKQQEIGNIT
jgi:hypothetical protein